MFALSIKREIMKHVTWIGFLGSLTLMGASVLAEPPRLGLEIELAIHNGAGQILEPSHLPNRDQRVEQILGFWRSVLPSLDFRVDREWVSETRQADGFELVTPPLAPDQIKTVVENYDPFLKAAQVGPGIKASLQFNVELRNLIPGFSLAERPTEKMGISYREIQNADIRGVVRLLLFLENYALQIYAAQAPQRLGQLMSHFAMPLSLEHPELLRELRELPVENQTYENVRKIFVRHHERERALTAYGPRTPWKYRSFNINKFFKLNDKDPEWIFPALEFRIADAPATAAELSRQTDLAYALVEASQKYDVRNWTQPSDMAEFLRVNRESLSFPVMIGLLNQHIVDWNGSEEGKKQYKDFLNLLGLKGPQNKAFARGQSAYISQTFQALSSKSQPLPYTYGAEFEYSNSAHDANMQTHSFLEQGISTEITGNHEVRTRPTGDPNDLYSQINTMREALGDDLRSIHLHTRASKSLIEKIGRRDFYTWLADIGDWIVALRAMYRRPNYAFNARTQQRMKIESPNGWIGHDKREYRGTMRTFEVGDSLDIEIRGLMTGIFDNNALPSKDYLKVAHSILIEGLSNPDLIPKMSTVHLASEFVASNQAFVDEVLQHAKFRGWKNEQLRIDPSLLLSALTDPERMLLPLQGFEFNPRLSPQAVQKLENAKLYWLDEVVKILTNHESNEKSKEAFLISIQNWAKRAQLAPILFQTLLTRPKENLVWDQEYLPLSPLRLSWMKKLISLQTGPNARIEFAVHLADWFRHARADFKQQAKLLTDVEKSDLLKVLANNLAPIEMADLQKILSQSLPAPTPTTKPKFKTNLQILLEAQSSAPIAAPSAPIAAPSASIVAPPATPATIPPNLDKILAEEIVANARSDKADSAGWAENAIRQLEMMGREKKLDALRFISGAAAAKVGCAQCEHAYIWRRVVALYQTAKLNRAEMAWVAEPWVNYAIQHTNKAYRQKRDTHGIEGLRAFNSIFSRETILRHRDLKTYYEYWQIPYPESEAGCEARLTGS